MSPLISGTSESCPIQPNDYDRQAAVLSGRSHPADPTRQIPSGRSHRQHLTWDTRFISSQLASIRLWSAASDRAKVRHQRKNFGSSSLRVAREPSQWI